MIGLYQHRDTFIHHLPAGLKMGVLLLASTLLFFVSSVAVLTLCLLLVILLYRIAKIRVRELWNQIYPVAWVLIFVFLGQLVFNHWSTAFEVVVRLFALVLLAALVTLTTRTSDMMDTIVYALRPLALLGFNPEKISLMLMLTVRYIPLLFQHYTDLRDAQRARGIDPGSLSLIVPLLIRALRLTDQLAEAIDARAYESFKSETTR